MRWTVHRFIGDHYRFAGELPHGGTMYTYPFGKHFSGITIRRRGTEEKTKYEYYVSTNYLKEGFNDLDHALAYADGIIKDAMI